MNHERRKAMECPKCISELKTNDLGEYGFVVIDICQGCEGAWFDKGELDRLDDSVWTNVEKIQFDKTSAAHLDLKCPKCQEQLEPISPRDAKEIVVDRCSSCEGFWLDRGELDQMRDVAAEVDSAKDMIWLKPPPDWSSLRWIIYKFQQCYFA
jgi:Zn-finger nucleic acid-binding protein